MTADASAFHVVSVGGVVGGVGACMARWRARQTMNLRRPTVDGMMIRFHFDLDPCTTCAVSWRDGLQVRD